jgi:hypothetical protein
MESNPEEFYGEASKWAFMFAPNFRDVMTEPEKGALHEALKEARRKEFDELVMRRMLRDTEEETVKQARSSGIMSRGQVTTAIGTSLNDVFGQAYLGTSQQQQDANNRAYNALSNAAITGTGILNSYNPALNDPNRNPYK